MGHDGKADDDAQVHPFREAITATPTSSCGLPLSSFDGKTDDPSHLSLGRWTRWCLRADPWPAVLFALVAMLGLLWQYRSPARAMIALRYYQDFFLVLFVLPLGRLAQLVLRVGYETYLGLSPNPFRSRRRFWPWFLVVWIGGYLVADLRLPLKLGFHASRGAFDRVADLALSDPENLEGLSGTWAGVYWIEGVEVIGSTVVLYLDRPDGRFGFARVPYSAEDHILNMPRSDGNPHGQVEFPLYSGLKDRVGDRIADDWFMVYSSYWSVKVGWS